MLTVYTKTHRLHHNESQGSGPVRLTERDFLDATQLRNIIGVNSKSNFEISFSVKADFFSKLTTSHGRIRQTNIIILCFPQPCIA